MNLTSPRYHALLIGIDQYPAGYNSLSGCVNDIDAIEGLLLTAPGIGIPPERITVTRLAAPYPGRPAIQSKSPPLEPTRANLVGMLKELAGPEVQESDSVLIYYSGHGDQKLWTGSMVWHEALVPHNGSEVEYLFDVELNALLRAIAARTSDLTVILDCCHSAGATRDLTGIQPGGKVRALQGTAAVVPPPDLTELGGMLSAEERSAGLATLSTTNAGYLVVVACQSDEQASEGSYAPGEPPHGVFTRSLLNVLGRKEGSARAALRWADIWPELLAEAAYGNARLRQQAQHPWIIGRSERKVFGGAWQKMDPGCAVTRRQDGLYLVGAGIASGITENAEIAVYGAEPRLFPPLGSEQDLPVGRLKVTRASLSEALASPLGAEFELPEGARGRLVRPGESRRLRVSLKPAAYDLKMQLAESPLLEIVPSDDPDAEVEVVTLPGGDMVLGNAVEPVVATVPAGKLRALRSGLEHYYRYNTVLRMASTCNDPQLGNSLRVQLLSCDDAAALKAMPPEELADPSLPEAARDGDRTYTFIPDAKFCVKVTNSSTYHLNVTLLNCSAGGLIEYLSDVLLRAGASHVMWLDNSVGDPFVARIDARPAVPPGVRYPGFVTERIMAIGTTRSDLSLRHLEVDKGVQDIVEEAVTRSTERYMRYQKVPVAPAELWTATLTPLRIKAA